MYFLRIDLTRFELRYDFMQLSLSGIYNVVIGKINQYFHLNGASGDLNPFDVMNGYISPKLTCRGSELILVGHVGIPDTKYLMGTGNNVFGKFEVHENPGIVYRGKIPQGTRVDVHKVLKKHNIKVIDADFSDISIEFDNFNERAKNLI